MRVYYYLFCKYSQNKDLISYVHCYMFYVTCPLFNLPQSKYLFKVKCFLQIFFLSFFLCVSLPIKY